MPRAQDESKSREGPPSEFSYYNNDRHDLLALVPKTSTGRVLEVGAAEGSTLVALKRNGKASYVVGVELKQLSENQKRDEIDEFIIADIEQMNLNLPLESFDVIICGDVLEHLRDPWQVLKYLCTFTKTGGTVVVSLPNILYWRALIPILTGDFRYAASGVLDKTHLRFFCKKNMIDLIASATLTINRVEPSFRLHRDLIRDRRINTFTFGLAERLLTQQYLFVATKT